MKKPNLSFQAFATTLAATVAAGAIAACGGASQQPQPQSPVQGTEVVSAPAKGGQASCSAAGCGAKKEESASKPATKSGQASCSAAGCGAKTGTEEKKMDDAKKDAPSTQAASTTTPAASSSSTAMPAKAPAAAAKPKPKASGQSSCGAGTCSAKK